MPSRSVMKRSRPRAEDFTVGWICALPIEFTAARVLLDEEYESDKDTFQFILGRMDRHDVVIACLPAGQIGTNSAATIATDMQSKFPALQVRLMVGIGGGVPSEEVDIRLGDVVISQPHGTHGGVVQYDFGKTGPGGKHVPTGHLDAPPRLLLQAVAKLRSNQSMGRSNIGVSLSSVHSPDLDRRNAGPDNFYRSSYNHIGGPTCDGCSKDMIIIRTPREKEETVIHYGTIASGNQVIKDGTTRDRLSDEFGGILCFEMEAAGLMNSFPCLVIRGICDYADSHKNKKWQPFAALAAATCAKEILSLVPILFYSNISTIPPLFMVPFRRDDNFVGRQDILIDIDKRRKDMASRNHLRLALVGLGGVGKSQIAIEYAYRVKNSEPQTSVFWVHASNASRFEQGFREIAFKAQIPGRDDPKMNILRLVYEWLSNESNGHWIMVLDNVDDDRVFSQISEDGKPPLETLIPQTQNGSVLVTSRNSLAAVNLVESQNILQIRPMNEDDSLVLLKIKIAVDDSSEADARDLIRTLGYLPLAITHAGAYISTRAPWVTISTYLKLFRTSENNQTHLLNNIETKDIRRDPSTRTAVITTWQISFEQIKETAPEAADLLALISMFDRQSIPETLLHDGKNLLKFEDAIAPLFSFSFVTAEVEQRSFEIHRLVQLSMIRWLEVNKQLEVWKRNSVQILAKAFPSGEYKNRIECQKLLPHARKALAYTPDKETESLLASLANNCAWYLSANRGEYQEAEALHRRALKAREKVLGPEHPSSLDSVNNLGWVLESQGKYEEAEAIHRRALIGYEKVLGPEHLDTLVSVNNLGSVLGSQGKYEEAEVMHRRALKAGEKVLGPEHPDTLISAQSLGLVLRNQGKYEEAETMLRRALKAGEKVPGPEHPDTLTSANNLGIVLERQGKYEEAEAIHRRALEAREKVLGPEHPDTLISVNNLGIVLKRQGKYEEAEVMHRRDLLGSKRVLGPEHPDTLMSANNLGSVLERQGKYEEAEAMHRRALEAREKVLRQDHPDTLTSVNNLGSVLGKQGKYEEAEAMHRRALEAREKVLGPEHPSTLISVDDLGLVLGNQGKYKEAEAMHRRALEAREKVLGPEHPETLTSVNNLGLVLGKQGKYKEAEAIHRRALEAREKVLGPEHPETLTSVNNLGSVLKSQGKYEEAEALR